jgi:hypothetical protein
MESMKRREMVEGPEAWSRFRNALKTVLATPKSALLKQERKEKQEKKKGAPSARFHPLQSGQRVC